MDLYSPIPITKRKEEKTPNFNEIEHNFAKTNPAFFFFSKIIRAHMNICIFFCLFDYLFVSTKHKVLPNNLETRSLHSERVCNAGLRAGSVC